MTEEEKIKILGIASVKAIDMLRDSLEHSVLVDKAIRAGFNEALAAVCPGPQDQKLLDDLIHGISIYFRPQIKKPSN